MRPKPPKAASAITGLSDKRAIRMAISMMPELMRVKDGTMMLVKTPKRQNRLFTNIRINRDGEARMLVSAGLLVALASKKLLHSAHDISDGGLFVDCNDNRSTL